MLDIDSIHQFEAAMIYHSDVVSLDLCCPVSLCLLAYVQLLLNCRWLATTHFEATDARAAFPCFDEPHLKANFSLAMVRDPHYISLFNTERLGTEDYENGWKLDKFATSVTMSTYLVAFVVCDFGSKSAFTAKSNIKVRECRYSAKALFFQVIELAIVLGILTHSAPGP